MTFEEAIGIKNGNIDIKTNEKVSYEEKYDRMIDLLGYDRVKLCLPFSDEELIEAYKKDKHFNNLPMKNWDLMSGFICEQGKVTPFKSLLTSLYRDHNITHYSNAEGVCLLKHCARRRLVEEYNKENSLC